LEEGIKGREKGVPCAPTYSSVFTALISASAAAVLKFFPYPVERIVTVLLEDDTTVQ
jgi:hypothetical protein